MKRQGVSYLAGILATVCYVSLALLAFSRYPGAYSPLSNWLSDLGSSQLNPQGSVFYNTGVVAAGALLAVFFLGLSIWRMQELGVQRAMLLAAQLSGFLGSLAMIMSALYPIDRMPQHRIWSLSLYTLLGTAFVFSVFALRYHPECPRWVLALGAITGLVDIVSGFLGTVQVLEWITVALFLAYVVVVGVRTRAVAAGAESVSAGR